MGVGADGHGNGAADALAQYAPASHGSHAVCPAASWNVPAAPLPHAPCAVSFCAVPALHRSGCCAPVLQKLPAGQTWHWPAASSPLSLPKRPAGHESAALLPRGQ